MDTKPHTYPYLPIWSARLNMEPRDPTQHSETQPCRLVSLLCVLIPGYISNVLARLQGRTFRSRRCTVVSFTGAERSYGPFS
ncbi:hypothetical protein EXIGLDRAFT_504199 [Exidia glandulosa HHB12029]|uniref:Uncharacterized protein n=1 Tax=Exidia glandulosa HHB12029 TaxID=1314781 RepID=A0A166N5N5_EXIGL|nr:hypothetical protein EXIGLDRAFT_504199 [Exidia glandulosa HHB12029]